MGATKFCVKFIGVQKGAGEISINLSRKISVVCIGVICLLSAFLWRGYYTFHAIMATTNAII